MTPHVAWFRWAPLALLVAAYASAAAAPAPVPVPAPIDSSHAAQAAPKVALRLPADIVYPHRGAPDSAVVFSHASHVTPGENACVGCHNGTYPMLRRGPAPRHGDMNAGGSCGACHDGRTSFSVRDAASCGTCHTGAQPAPAAAAGSATPGKTATDPAATAALRLPRPHAYPQGDGSPGVVTFRHKTHAKDADACATCHPKPWRKLAAPPLAGGAMHDPGACGGCHDGKKSFATDDDAHCARCHRDTGARP